MSKAVVSVSGRSDFNATNACNPGKGLSIGPGQRNRGDYCAQIVIEYCRTVTGVVTERHGYLFDPVWIKNRIKRQYYIVARIGTIAPGIAGAIYAYSVTAIVGDNRITIGRSGYDDTLVRRAVGETL
ncbi:MAG TPA: hypothetical protein VKB27_21200 [Gammaproteobacteria bacterium]|nr:hypothetical protein [Gammaproteobacteria bacterium]